MRGQPGGVGRMGRWRGLILFWALIAVTLGGGAVSLQVLGPLAPPPLAHSALVQPALVQPEPGKTSANPLPETEKPAQVKIVTHAAPERAEPAPPKRGQRPGSVLAGPIAAPDPALLEPGNGGEAGMLPRIGADGRTPGQVYARGFAAEAGRPQIGLVLAGIGMNDSESAQAIASLPAELTLAISPYGAPNPALLEHARRAGHELLLAIPMEPMGYPLNDPGEHALLTGAMPEQNKRNLDWALGRFAGYAGVTSALGGRLNGERFPMLADQMRPVLSDLAARGLFYVDARVLPKSETGAPPPALPQVWSRSIDLIVDDPADAAALETKLTALEAIARDKGSALGLVGMASPVVLERLAAWTNGLAGRGFALAPASALMRPPGEAPE